MASIIKVGDSWRALVRRKGHPVYCKTLRTKTQAQAWARAIEADIERGQAPQPASVMGRALLVADVIAAYRALREHSRPISDASTEHYMLNHLIDGLGTLDATRINPQDLAGFCRARADAGAGAYTCNMEMSKLGTALRFGALGLKVQLPDVVAQARPLLSHLGLIGGGGKRARRPTEDELHQLLAHLGATYGQRYADAARFAVLTAMRRGEVVRVAWDDLDTVRRLVLIRDRKDPRKKVGNHQWVPLLGDAFELAQAQSRSEGEARIFPIHEQTLSKYFNWSCKALSIPDLHFHDLRHEGTSRLFEDGYRIEQVALVTGHKDWRHLARYTNLKPEDLHRAGTKKSPLRGLD